MKCASLVKSLPITGPWKEFRQEYYWTEVYPNALNMAYKDNHDDVEFSCTRIEDIRGDMSVNDLLKKIFDVYDKEEEKEAREARARVDKLREIELPIGSNLREGHLVKIYHQEEEVGDQALPRLLVSVLQ